MLVVRPVRQDDVDALLGLAQLASFGLTNLPKDRHYLKFMPIPTELCILCAGRTAKGKQPACVQTCMAACMKYGRIEDLAKEITKPRMVLWAPKGSSRETAREK